MARPVITGLDTLLRDKKMSTVLIIDNSYSVEARPGPPTRTSTRPRRRGRSSAASCRAPTSPSSRWPAAPWYADDPTFDLDRVQGELGKMRAGYGAASVPDAINVARAVQPRLNHLNREVIVLSDFQKVTWSDQGLPAAERSRLAGQLAEGKTPPRLTFFHVGKEVTENISVEELKPSREILGVGQRLGWTPRC